MKNNYVVLDSVASDGKQSKTPLGRINIISTQKTPKMLDLKYIAKLTECLDGKFILNFGAVKLPEIEKEITKVTILNPVKGVEIAKNKILTKRELLKHNIDFCTTYIFSKGEVIKIGETDTIIKDLCTIQFPAVLKKKEGSKGEGMVVVKDVEELRTILNNPIPVLGKFFTANYNKTQILSRYFLEEIFNKGVYNEIRVHGSPILQRVPVYYDFTHIIETEEGNIDASEAFYNNKGVVFVTQKFSKANEDGEFIFGKNINLGAAYWSRSKFLRNMPKYKGIDSIMTAAVNSVKAVKLDLGAVDVVFTRSGKYAVLEVNSAPAIAGDNDTRTLQCYNEAIPMILAKKNHIKYAE